MAVRIGAVGALLVALHLGIGGGTASAEVLEGACTGSVAFETGTADGGPFTVDVAADDGDVYVVPRADSVTWEATTAASSGSYAGYAEVLLPFPLPPIRLDEWDGEVRSATSSGDSSYDLPGVVPGGVEFEVRAEQADSAGTCVGRLRLELEAGGFGSVLAWVLLGLLALLLVAMLAAMGVLGRARGDSEGRAGVARGAAGGSAGLLFGGTLGLNLVVLGALPLATPLVFALAMFFMALGAAVGGGLIGRRRKKKETS